MLNRDDPGLAPTTRRPGSERINSAATLIVALSGVMGAAGVGLSAAATHGGGGTLAATAGLFLILHAVAGLGLAALARSGSFDAGGLLVSAAVLMVGTVIFAADLALIGFAGLHPFPMAAPIGGVMMIGGWFGLPLSLVLRRQGRM